jgi:hypothetical protein
MALKYQISYASTLNYMDEFNYVWYLERGQYNTIRRTNSILVHIG